MANICGYAISILVENLNSGRSFLITAVLTIHNPSHANVGLQIWKPNLYSLTGICSNVLSCFTNNY